MKHYSKSLENTGTTVDRLPPEIGTKVEILTFESSFHGRTMAGISATGQEKVKIGFAPLLSGFRHLPFNDLAAVERLFLARQLVFCWKLFRAKAVFIQRRASF